MNHKKLILSIICVCIVFFNVLAQKGDFLLSTDIGYGFPSGEQDLVPFYSNSPHIIPYSLGKGINFTVVGDYMFSDCIGAGLDLNMLIGVPTGYTYSANSSKDPLNVKNSYTGFMFGITPNLIFCFPGSRFNPYARFGLVIGFAEYTLSSSESGNNAQTGQDVWLYSGNDPSIGWYAALGIRLQLKNKRMLNIELFDRDLTYAPGSESNIEAFNGGKTNSNSIPLVYSYTRGNSASNVQLTSVMPFGSAGIKVGMTFDFGTLKLAR